MRFFARKCTPSSLALALALVAGGSVAAMAVAEPAAAQDKKDGETAKPDYSKEFITAYNVAGEPIKDEATADYAAAKAKLPAVNAVAKSADEKFEAGSLSYRVANKLNDPELKIAGLRMMAESGKGDVKTQGQISYALFEAERAAGNMDAARTALQRAIDIGYSFDATFSDGSTGKIGPNDMRSTIMRTYIDADQAQQGVDYAVQQIEKQASTGKPDETLLRSAYVAAFQNELGPEVTKLGEMWVKYYPSPTAWGDVMAGQRNYYTPTEPALLDALRLLARTDALRNERDYNDYINAADARRLPSEVAGVIDRGIAAGKINTGDSFIKEAKTEANSRLASEKADLSSLATDARKSGVSTRLIVAAANSQLSNGKAATAEELYALALQKPDVDKAEALTRMGIAQIDQGKYDEAQATFAKVDGDQSRKNIAQLWSIYAAQQAAGSTGATASAATGS
ncbi:hypothetical protein F7D01_14550 [Erythrobacter sp. 3-20A1M]|uniref:hypothetical protein n=1 Tax=Erythrobacter sp. 3-20A1M TaxID=2653850 RepID=UPI001BFC45FD|nr:hypothetical protein [Erythrobacter sp. 3-20A1M]QWC58124.1 hypothetical protein F7D01_14550 [Erythrobacter sp. 3-20A1M]